MRSMVLVPLLLAGCVTGIGQKVTVLLTDRELSCVVPEGGGDAVARLQLDQPEDFYKVEIFDSQGVARNVASTRNGLRVTFACPDGFSSLIVQHATVLQARKEAEQPADDPAPSDGDDGGSNVPGF